jgi:predicted transposase YbfD/YdcC
LVSSLSPGSPGGPEPDGEPVSVTVAGLRERCAGIPDHRNLVWVDHPLAAVLVLCAAAVVAGMRSFTAIAGWIADAPAELLTCAYAGSERPVPARGPSKVTVWRVLTGIDAVGLDAVIGGWLLDQAYAETLPDPEPDPDVGDDHPRGPSCGVGRLSSVAIAADGKTCRGAKTADGQQVHLLSAMTHDTRLVLAQTDVGAKTNEVPRLKDLLGDLDLRGAIVTVDALHTVRATAKWLVGQGIDFAITVKENTPKLFAALDGLAWDQVPIGHDSTDRGHGRITRRTIQTLPAPDDLPFPHVAQVFLIERSVTDLQGKNLSSVAALGVTSRGSDRAGPDRLAGLIRGHWAIEAMHWIRSPGVLPPAA